MKMWESKIRVSPDVVGNDLEVEDRSIYQILHQMILELRLKPGAVMSIKDICEYFGFGRSPVRDALIALERDGLITFLPQRGTMISKIDLKRMEEERFLRYSVESNIMQEFMAHYTAADISSLEVNLWDQEASVTYSDPRKFLELDDQFHSVFYQSLDKTYSESVLKGASGHYQRVRLLSLTDQSIWKQVIVQHREMLTAFKTRDMNLLQDIFAHHINHILRLERDLKKQYRELFVGGDSEEKRSDFLGRDYLDSLLPSVEHRP